MTEAQRIHALKSLVGVLASALRIVQQTHYTDPALPQFTPDRAKEVVETALICAKAGETL